MPIPPSHPSIELSECRSYLCIFEIIRNVVRKRLGLERKGLMLGTQDLPDYLLAYHPMGSNIIVINRKMLEKIKSASRNDSEIVNSYLFSILLHEYLHAVGIRQELKTHKLTTYLCERELGPDHLATRISKHGIRAIFSALGRAFTLDSEWSPHIANYYSLDAEYRRYIV